MKYQFKSSDFKQRFAEHGAIYAEVAEFVGMLPFELTGRNVKAIDGQIVKTMAVPINDIVAMATAIAPQMCFVVKDDDVEETREQKIERLCHVIAYGQFQAQPAPCQLIISPELSLTFDDDRGSITVSAMYNGNFCYDIFSQAEQDLLYKAFEFFTAEAERKEKEDFFMNVKF